MRFFAIASELERVPLSASDFMPHRCSFLAYVYWLGDDHIKGLDCICFWGETREEVIKRFIREVQNTRHTHCQWIRNSRYWEFITWYMNEATPRYWDSSASKPLYNAWLMRERWRPWEISGSNNIESRFSNCNEDLKAKTLVWRDYAIPVLHWGDLVIYLDWILTAMRECRALWLCYYKVSQLIELRT